MIHTYNDNKLTNLCSICSRAQSDHGDIASCEACQYIGPCELTESTPQLLLCPSCMEKEVIARETVIHPYDTKRARTVALLNRLDKEIPMDRRAYFVGRISAIVDIEQELIDIGEANPQYQLASIVESNIIRLRQNIIDAQQTIRESQGEIVADQRYLNSIVPQLRIEEREKFKAYDITYKPAEVIRPTASASKPRMSASDKALESMAKLLGISTEQAARSLAAATKQVIDKSCTCKETPGFCQIHGLGQ